MTVQKHDSYRARSWLRDYVRLLNQEAEATKFEFMKDMYLEKSREVQEYLSEQDRLQEEYLEELQVRSDEAMAKLATLSGKLGDLKIGLSE